MAEVFEDYEVCSWKVGNQQGVLKFPVKSIQETGGNRIVERNRPYRDGAKLDDVGSNATKWTVEAIFENSLMDGESGLDKSRALYPTILNLVIDSFRIHGTGDLVLPTRGKVRARAESYTRVEADTERDFARLTLVFCEDNEDNVDAQKFQQLQVNASARRLTETTQFDAQSEGAWKTSMADLREFGAELEAFSNFPGSTRADLDTQVGIVQSTIESIFRTGEKDARENVHNAINDPEGSRLQRKLEETNDVAGRSRAQPRAGRRRMVPFRVESATDLFTVASQLGQSIIDLLDINPSVNPDWVEAGTVINIFEEP
jgi:hypothetical protein